jgi:hypothetical protein
LESWIGYGFLDKTILIIGHMKIVNNIFQNLKENPNLAERWPNVEGIIMVLDIAFDMIITRRCI